MTRQQKKKMMCYSRRNNTHIWFFHCTLPSHSVFFIHCFFHSDKVQGINQSLASIFTDRTLNQIEGGRGQESDRLEKLNPGSNRQIGRQLLCSCAGLTNAVNITSLSGYCPIRATDPKTYTQGFCCLCNRLYEASRGHASKHKV